MPSPRRSERDLLEKLRGLSPDWLAEVEDFVDFLRQRNSDAALVLAAARLSEDSFREVWDNPDDDDFDRL